MITITQEDVLNRYDTLPDDIKEALFDVNSFLSVQEAGDSFKFNETDIQKLATLAGDVLMGFIYPDTINIAEEIAARFSIPRNQAEQIAGILYKNIFKPFEGVLRKNYSAPLSNSQHRTIDSVKIPLSSLKENSSPAPTSSPPAPQKENLRFDGIKSPLEKDQPFKPITQPISTQPEPVKAAPEPAEQPFMIHEEKPLFATEGRQDSPSFSFKTPQTFKPSGPASNPARIKDDRSSGNAVRIVHYSNLRTLLSFPNPGEGKEV